MVSKKLKHNPAEENTNYVRKNPKWFTIWVISSILTLAGGYLIGTTIKSPLDDAQKNSNTPQVATYKAENREFTPEIVQADGQLTNGQTQQVTGIGAQEGQKSVITQINKNPGETIASGQVLLHVSGQAIIVLKLPFPLYRDLTPGTNGEDVKALQTELKRLGYYSGKISGNYDSNVAASVRKLFQNNGVTAPEANTETKQAVTEAEKALNVAQSETVDPEDPAAATTKKNNIKSLQETLNQAKEKADTPLLAKQIMTINQENIEVLTLPAVGQSIEETNTGITLRQQGITITGRLSVTQATTLKSETPVRVESATNNQISAQGTIVAVSDFKEADDTNTMPGYDYVVTLNETPDEALLSENKIVIQPLDAGNAKEGLSVPLLAVKEDNKGKYVEKVADTKIANQKDKRQRIGIEIEQQQDGYVLLKAQDNLKTGDLVTVGQ